MATPLPFPYEKLICGAIYHDDALLDKIAEELTRHFGEIDYHTIPYNFSEISPYYNEELGGDGKRIWFSFKNTVDPSKLAEIKLLTNKLEEQFMHDGLRPVNLDPGLINRGRLSLATTKEAAHRMALSDGIYIEMTLFYCRKKWNFLPWTYLDFKTDYVLAEMEKIRKIYLSQRKQKA